MRIKRFIDEDFVQYKKPVMFIGTCFCNWKCCTEQNLDKTFCQNSSLAKSPIREVDNEVLIERYLDNPITKAIVFGGLEPFEQFKEIYDFINDFREESEDEVVIYTGYNLEEIKDKIMELKDFENVIIKFGRYIPNDENKFDEILGVKLASKNQYAMRLDDYVYENGSR